MKSVQPSKSPAVTTSPTLLAEEAAARAASITKEGGREEAISRGSPPARNLLVAVDGSDESYGSVRWTLENLYKKGEITVSVYSVGFLMSQNPPSLSMCRAYPCILLRGQVDDILHAVV